MKAAIFIACILPLAVACDTRFSDHPMSGVPAVDTDYRQAWLADLDQKIKSSPRRDENYYRKALILIDLERQDEAIPLVEKASSLNPDNAKYRLLMARLKLDGGKAREALREARLAESLGMQRPELYRTLAELHLDMNEAAKARYYTKKALSLDPASHRAILIDGLVMLAEGDTAGAETRINESIAAAPSPKAYSALTDIALYHKDYDKAFRYLRLQMEYDPANTETALKKALLHKDVGHYDSARYLLHQLIAGDTAETKYYRHLAQVHLSVYRYDSAIFYINKLLSADQNNKEALLTLARIYDRRGWYSSAIAHYKQLLELDSAHGDAQAELKNVYGKLAYLRRIQEEKQKIQSIETVEPKSVDQPQL